MRSSSPGSVSRNGAILLSGRPHLERTQCVQTKHGEPGQQNSDEVCSVSFHKMIWTCTHVFCSQKKGIAILPQSKCVGDQRDSKVRAKNDRSRGQWCVPSTKFEDSDWLGGLWPQ